MLMRSVRTLLTE